MGVTLALGVPAAGKTLALQDLVHDACLEGWVCYAVDRPGEWAKNLPDGKPNPRWRGAPPLIEDASDDYDAAFEQALAARDAAAESGTGRVLRFGYPWEPLDVAEILRDVGDGIYVDDEIDYAALKQGWDENPLRDFVHRGRHLPDAEGVPREVHIMGAARRPQSLHTDVTSMAEQVLIFRISGKWTLKRVEEEGWLEGQQLLTARTMPNLRYFHWKNDGSITPGKLTPAKF